MRPQRCPPRPESSGAGLCLARRPACLLVHHLYGRERPTVKCTMADLIHIPADGSEPEMTEDEATIHVDRYAEGGRGRATRVLVEIPAPWDDDGAAKEVMMDLPGPSARQWNSGAEAWEVRLDWLNRLVAHFTDAGYDVTVDLGTAQRFDEYGKTGLFLGDRR